MPALRSEELTFTSGPDRVRGHGVWPRREERLPAVVIVPDVRGLSDHYRDIARRLAEEGFFALAIDLYSREGTPELPTMESVFAWMRSLDDRVRPPSDAIPRGRRTSWSAGHPGSPTLE